MYNKLLTISVAAFNVERTLDNTLASLAIGEPYLDKLEVIIVNDGSTDGSENIARRYVARYPDSFRLISKNNEGYGSTLTSSLKEAQGMYFKVVDGGDEVDTEGLRSLLRFIEDRHPGKTADLILSPFLLHDERNAAIKCVDIHECLSAEAVPFENFGLRRGVAIFEMCMRTELLRQRHGEFLTRSFYTDNELTMAAMLYSKTVSAFKKPVTIYKTKVPGQSMSVDGLQKHYLDTFKVSLNIFDMYASYIRKSESPLLTGSRKSAVEDLLAVLARLTYISAMIRNNPLQYRTLLASYDEKIKSFDAGLYEITDHSKIVRLARRSGNAFYRLMCVWIKFSETHRLQW